jgi:UDP-N-acetylmuramoyl-tripeptide--D-alanyl-D-alanine ligase
VGLAPKSARRFFSASLRRRRFLYAWYTRVWPVAGFLAALYRRVVVPRTKMVAIVGSFGKTTTSRVVAAGLLGPGVFRLMGNYETGIAHRILESRPADRYQVLEVGIKDFGQMEMSARMIGPSIVVVTGIGTEHNRTFGTAGAVRREKCRMVSALPSTGLAVLNGDDPNVLWMAGRTRARVVTFGFGRGNDVRAADVRLDWPHGMTFTVHANGVRHAARTGLIGRHMVLPVLATVGIAVSEGLELDRVLGNIAGLQPELGRMQPVRLPNGAIILRDDFKAPLETVYAALDALAELPARRKIVVMGEVSEPVGGRRPAHRAVGARTAEVADIAVFIGQGRRASAAGAARAGMPRDHIVKAGYGVNQAIDYLKEVVEPGDVILLKGRLAQRLERIAIALQGRPVRCGAQECRVSGLPCEQCPRLDRAWGQPRARQG